MKKRITKKEKRRLTLIIMSFLFIIVFMCVNILPDWLQISQNKKELALLKVNYENLLTEEKSLKAEVQKLQNPEYVERYAKYNYFYTKENEIIIRKSEN